MFNRKKQAAPFLNRIMFGIGIMGEMNLAETEITYQKVRIDNSAAFNAAVGEKQV